MREPEIQFLHEVSRLLTPTALRDICSRCGISRDEACQFLAKRKLTACVDDPMTIDDESDEPIDVDI